MRVDDTFSSLLLSLWNATRPHSYNAWDGEPNKLTKLKIQHQIQLVVICKGHGGSSSGFTACLPADYLGLVNLLFWNLGHIIFINDTVMIIPFVIFAFSLYISLQFFFFFHLPNHLKVNCNINATASVFISIKGL